jgi:hypothetical protein
MTGFPSGILRPFGFANKPDATELPRGPIEAKHLLSIRASAGCFFGIKAHLHCP